MFTAKDIRMKRVSVLLLFWLTCFCSNAQSDSIRINEVFTFVEQMPEYPGGDGELIKFLVQNVQYPQYERDRDIQGKVLVRFVVTEDGSVKDVTVVRGVSPGLDKEAVRVLRMLPRFKPGMQQGKPVSVYYNIPIVFKLSGPDPAEKKKKGKKKKR
jgi:TonB family protein